MKKNKFIILSAAIFLFLQSCSDGTNNNLVFNVKTTAEIVNDTLVVKKDSVINFMFEGNPENIVFFSGETERDFQSFNKTQIPSTEFDSCFLNFEAKATGEIGTIENTLSFFISENYTGLIGTNYALDSTAMRSGTLYSWADLTAACGFPTESGVTKPIKLNMMDYLSKRISMQFKYQTNQNIKTQPAWAITNLKFVLYQKAKTAVEVPAATVGFRALDIINSVKPYATSGVGVWNKSAPANISIASTAIDIPTNEDYLVSNPYIINTITPSKGVTVKNTTNNLIPFTYKYTTVGVYTLTLVATNIGLNGISQQKLVTYSVKVL